MRRPLYSILSVCAVLGFGSVLAGNANADSLDDVIANHPSPETAAFYQTNADAVRERLDAISTGSGDERAEALELLSIEYPEVAVFEAQRLISDAHPTVAAAAVRIVSSSLVMSQHSMPVKADASMEFDMMVKKQAVQELRKILHAPVSGEAKEVALTTLVSLADRKALEELDNLVGQGRIDQKEAIRLFALSNTDVGAAYVAQYLNVPDPAVRSAAATYLASVPTFMLLIRNKVFLNRTEEAQVRAAAATALAKFDPQYADYVTQVLIDPNLSADLFEASVNGYVDNLRAAGTLDPAGRTALVESLRNYQKARPDVDIQNTIESLDR